MSKLEPEGSSAIETLDTERRQRSKTQMPAGAARDSEQKQASRWFQAGQSRHLLVHLDLECSQGRYLQPLRHAH